MIKIMQQLQQQQFRLIKRNKNTNIKNSNPKLIQHATFSDKML